MIGDPVKHSVSPAIHNSAFEALGLDWVYVALEVSRSNLATFISILSDIGFQGVSITMPYKELVAGLVDILEGDARKIRSVNTIRVTSEGTLEGHSTDGPGFLACLNKEFIDTEGLKVGILGAGGAARAVSLSLLNKPIESLVVVNRTPERCDSLVGLDPSRVRVGKPSDLASCDLVINATPLGMGPNQGLTPVDPGLFSPGQIYVDLIYWPPATKMMVALEKRGVRVVSGISMLVHQAALAFELWTGLKAPLDVMTRAAVNQLISRSNYS